MNSPAQYIDEHKPQWFAIRTQFRKEKFVLGQLERKGIEVYIPLQNIRRVYKSKVKNVELPLIPLYAFVKITRRDYVKVLGTPGFVSFVNFSGLLTPIPCKEMEILKMIVAEEHILKCVSEDLITGDWVEIKSGNLVGMTGQLVEEKGKRGFVLRLERMGFFLTIDIEKHLLRKVSAA